MLSLCFKSPFNNTKLKQMSTKVSAKSYLKFLEGKHFSTEMLQYDYHKIIFNISDYIVNYWLGFRNATSKLISPTNRNIHGLKSTFAGFWLHRFYNCYGLQMPDNNELTSFSVHLKSNIFPSGIRPQAYDFFTLLHYPKHLTRSIRNIRFSWTPRTANATYGMIFTVNEVEIIKHRNKNKQPCNQNGDDYDDVVHAKHLEMVGCRAPYHNSNIKTKLCSTRKARTNCLSARKIC